MGYTLYPTKDCQIICYFPVGRQTSLAGGDKNEGWRRAGSPYTSSPQTPMAFAAASLQRDTLYVSERGRRGAPIGAMLFTMPR